VSFSDEERAELIAALSLTSDMVGILLTQLELLLDARDSGRAVNDAEAAQIREHVAMRTDETEQIHRRANSGDRQGR
jgi:hypothetical protein